MMKNKLSFFLKPDLLLSVVLCLYAASLYFANTVITYATVLLVASGLAFIIRSVRSGRQKLSPPHPAVYCWLAVYLVRVAWLPLSSDLQNGLRWLDTCLPFILFPLLFQYLPLSERVLKTVLAFFVHFTLLFCAVSLLTVAYLSITVPIDIKEWLLHPKSYLFAYVWTNYDHPSFLCVVYLLALPAGLYLKRKYRAVSTAEIIALIVVETALLAFTGARVGFIILPLLLLVMFLYRISVKRKIIAAGSLAVLAGAIVIGLTCLENQFTDRFEDPARMQLWKTAMASIREKPLLGTGTGGMKAVMTSPELAAELGYPEAMPFSYPHNQYLGEVMHFGCIGAAALFGTLLYLLILSLRRKDFLLQSLLLILFVFMFTEMPFDSHKAINLSLFFISLCIVTLPLRTDTAPKNATP
ncbi:MAG: O-antigen ligase family protein [Prevotellaceae bacterium]|jgi:O-antigen ligase|nr:O-antigen ligase family protein [Prevotellaceae bacterium]